MDFFFLLLSGVVSHLGRQSVSPRSFFDESRALPEAASDAVEDPLHPETSNPTSITTIATMFLL
jgi:hypothetical protein